MSTPTPKSESYRDLTLDEIRRALSYFKRELTSPPDVKMLNTWSDQLDTIERDAARSIDCAIALLGESGAGKSSLLNAILAVDLLPHDAGSAVTAAVTEIVNCDAGYEVSVQLEPASEFISRFREICGRLRESVSSDSLGSGSIDRSDESTFRAVTGVELDKFNEQCVQGEEEAILLPQVRAILNSDEVVSWKYGESEFDSAKEKCRQCLSSREPLWPIVRKVTVKGPFALLKSGITLVDVPGLNDPDPNRNAIAENSLQRAQVVWLVLNGKRAVTKAISQYLTDSRLLSRLQIEGRLSSLVVVATHADQYDEDGLAQAFGLRDRESLSLDALLDMHAQRVKLDVQSALGRVWDETVSQAEGHVDEQSAVTGRSCLQGCPFFSVSSTDSLQLQGVTKTKRGPSFERLEQTRIPSLVQWMQTDFVAKEKLAHKERVRRRTAQLIDAIRATLRHRESIQRKLSNLHSEEKGGLQGIQVRAQTFLSERLADHEIQARKEVETQAEKVRAAIRSGVQAAKHEIESDIPSKLRGIHWGTLRAIARRDGVFSGSSRDWDIPFEVAAAVSRRIAFRWAELFETTIEAFLESVGLKCADLLAQHSHFMLELLRSVLGEELPGIEKYKQPTEQLDFELDMLAADIRERLHVSRMSFERALVINLRDKLRPAFKSAASQTGSGMKDRMISIIERNLTITAPEIFPVLARDLEEKVVEVNGMLNSQVSRAHDSVRRVALNEANNIRVSLFERTPAELLAEADVIAKGLRPFENV